MVEETVDDGRRVAELLSSELSGRSDGVLSQVSVANPDRDVSGSPAGDRAYDVAYADDVIGAVFVHDTRARLVIEVGVEAARAVAADAGLEVRGSGGASPDTIVLLEDGAAVKQVIPAVRAAVEPPAETD